MQSSSTNATEPMPTRARRLAPVKKAAPKPTAERQHALIERLKEEGGRRVPVYLDGEGAKALAVVMRTDGYESATGALCALVKNRAKVIRRRA
jgi:hypothetical protein